MTSIILNKVSIENFKGIKKYEREFFEKENLISAHFGSGKTTIRQSLNYVFGLKVEDYRPFLVEDGVWVANKDAGATIVKWTITVDNGEMPITYEFQVKDTGKTTTYFIDNIKYGSKKAYQEKLIEYLEVGSVDRLETISQLDSFLSSNWNVQRETLKKITNVNEKLINVQKQEKYIPLYNEYFVKNVGETDIKKSLKQRRKQLENDKLVNDNNIDNCKREIEEYSKYNFKDLQEKLKEIESNIIKLDDIAKKAKINELKAQLAKLEAEHSSRYSELSGNLINHKRLIEDCNYKIKSLNDDIETEKRSLNSSNRELQRIENEVFDKDTKKVCPYCGSEISQEKLEEQFNNSKKERIEDVRKDVENSNEIITKSNNELKEVTSKLKKAEDEMASVNKEIEETADAYYNKQDAVELAIFELENTSNEEELNVLKKAKEDILKQLSYKAIIDNDNAKIETYTQEQIKNIEIEQQLALLEELVNDYSEETKTIFDTHINSYFQKEVHWQLFSKLVSTGETKEDCILLCNNKNYNTACSTGERLMAKVLVVQGLQKILNINFPIFVDDFNDLGIKFKSNQQLILLETKANFDLENIERF